MESTKRHELSFLLGATLFPLLFTLFWLLNNSQLPTADATDYLFTGNSIYHHFSDQGFLYGLLHFDIARGWRPIFFSVFLSPFLLISNGNIHFAFQAVVICSLIASAMYVYLLARISLDRLSSLITANLICLLPLVQAPALTFYAESALFPVIIGSIYHLIKSDYFRQRKHNLGFIICFSLALMIRPIETITALMFVLPVFFIMGWKKNIFSISQIITTATLAAFAIFLFVLFVLKHYLHHRVYDAKLAQFLYISLQVSAAFFLSLFAGSIWLYFKRKDDSKNQTPLVKVFFISIVIVMAWFLPHAFQTYAWIYRTSFGDLAELSSSFRMQQPIWNVLSYFTFQESFLVVSGVFFIAIISAILNKREALKIILSSSFCYLLLLIPFSLWEILNTFQTGIRKLNPAFPALLIALLLVGLQKGKWYKSRVFTACLLLIAQFYFSLSVIYPSLQLASLQNLMGVYPAPINLQPNPHDELLKFFNAEMNKFPDTIITLHVNATSILPIDPYLLMLMKNIRNDKYTLKFPGSMDPIQHDEIFFLTDKVQNMVISNIAEKNYALRFQSETDPALKAMYRLLYLYSSNQLLDVGLTVGPCTIIKAKDNNAYKGCLIFHA